MENLVFACAIIGVLGIGAQWLAWRTNTPAIVLMSIAGVIAGPVLGVFTPESARRRARRPWKRCLVSSIGRLSRLPLPSSCLKVGLQLNFAEIRGLKSGRRASGPAGRANRLGPWRDWRPITSPVFHGQVALLFGGIMVVTGPTVIIPLLRQSKLNPRPAALLKWEGIVNDPIGALLAVLVFDFVVYGGVHGTLDG